MYQKRTAISTKSYCVTFGHAAFKVVATNVSAAIQSAKELAGPGAAFLSCIQQDEW
jgi:hypothetical protein